jgi:uncharacterized protein (TIGR01777 family)
MAQRKLIIAGGSGFLGQCFAQHLADTADDDWEIVILSRSKPKIVETIDTISHAKWDGRSLGVWTQQLRECTHVLNLAGRSVDCRKTPGRCDEILRSRVESTRVLGEAFRSIEHEPEVWVQMSTAHIYGDPPSTVCDENSPFGYGLAPTVGQAWEAEFESACPASTRSVVLRTSFVLGRQGGAFPTLRRVAALGLGGKMGTGTQGISWLHVDDMNRIFEDALLNETRNGVYIATSPEPVSYLDFMRSLRTRLGMPIGLPGSAIGLRFLCATVLDSDPELVLSGRYCVPKRLMDEGFSFNYATLDEALVELVPRT